ncbi:MAG: MBG domain-containing protein, partial [Microbacteriaceae bacterium]
SLDNSNYAITFVSADLTISKKTISVTLDAKSKKYGDADPGFTYSSTGLLQGDSLDGVPTRVAGETAGTYDITTGTLSGGSNYTVSGVTPGTFTIEARPITVTMGNDSKDYGTADPASFAYTVTTGNLVNSDTATGSGSRVAGANVGSYTISKGSLSFGANYDVTFVDGSFTINPVAIELTAVNKSKQFGGSDPALTYTVTSGVLVGGDALSGSLSRTEGETVGSYTISAGTVTAGSNYTVTVNNGTFEITTRPITVTAAAKLKTYGDVDPAFTWSVTSGSVVTGYELTGDLSRVTGDNVGTYAITQGSLDNSNYAITFVSADLTINAKDITVVADNKSKFYGDTDPEFTFSSADLLESDSLSGTASRASGEAVSSYNITQGSVTAGSNYNITFTAGTLTIDARPITLTVDNQSMDFGDSVPSNSFTVSVGELAYSDAISGLTYSYDSTVSNAGTYAITGATATFSTGAAGNYDITYIDGELTVDPKPLTYTLAGETISWGESIPTFDGTTGDLVGSDAIDELSFTYNGSSFAPLIPGTFEVGGEVQTFSSGSADNYVITVVPATLTITGPQLLAITPDEGFVVGGMPFEITGSGFGFDAPTVEFDGLAATDIVLVDSNTITGLTPKHAEGLVDVVVTTTEGPETLTGVYTYIPLPPSPEISTMFPPRGQTVGGTLVTFTGANLRDSAGNPAQVTFDGLPGIDEAVSDDGTSLTVRTPAHVVETVDVEVSTDTGIVTLPQAFTYFDGPIGDVSGKLWIDANLDGVYQDSEAPLPNMEIRLIRQGDLDPQFGPEDSPLQSFGANIKKTSIPGAVTAPSVFSAGVVYFWVGYTDANGNYDIPALPYGNYVLVYTLPDDFTQTVGGGTPGAIRFSLSAPVLEQDLAGSGFSTLISNQVVYMESGDPVPFADVLLVWSASDGQLGTADDVRLPVTTDENGEFIFGGLSSGVYDVQTYEDDPMVAMSKPVVLGSYVTQTGGVWEIFERPEEDGSGGELAATGFGAGSLSLSAMALLAAGLALAVIRRSRRNT